MSRCLSILFKFRKLNRSIKKEYKPLILPKGEKNNEQN